MILDGETRRQLVRVAALPCIPSGFSPVWLVTACAVAVTVSVAGCLIIVDALTGSPSVAIDTAVLLLAGAAVATGIWSVVSVRRDLRAGAGPFALVALGASPVFLAVALSALVAIERPEATKLYRLGVAGIVISDVGPAVWWMLVSSCMVACALALPLLRPVRARSPLDAETARSAHTVLSLASLVGVLVGSGSEVDFAMRGTQSGEGAAALLYWCIPVAVSLAILQRHWGSRLRLLVSVIGVFHLFEAANRSPLLLIVCALVLRVLRDSSSKKLVAAMAVSPAIVVLMAAMSTWRGSRIHDRPISYLEAVREVLTDPVGSLATAGFDSLFGLQLSLVLADDGVRAAWWTPLMAVGNFIPRQLWRGKPQIFGTEITRDHIGIRGGGIFLSGLGYLTFLTGSVLVASVIFAVLMRQLSILVRMYGRDPLFASIVLMATIRITMAGDPLDLFLTLQALLLYVCATLPVRMWRRWAEAPHRRGLRPIRQSLGTASVAGVWRK